MSRSAHLLLLIPPKMRAGEAGHQAERRVYEGHAEHIERDHAGARPRRSALPHRPRPATRR